MENKIRIAVYDNLSLFVEGVCCLLKDRKDLEIIEIKNWKNLLFEWLKNNIADIVVYGGGSSSKEYFEFLEVKKSNNISAKILFLANSIDLKEIKRLFKAGASGYIDNKSSAQNITMAIDVIMKGRVFIDSSTKEKIVLNICGEDSIENIRNAEENLTAREIEVMKYICEGHNSKEISEELFISVNTVETHRKKILSKLNVKNSIGVLKYALKNRIVMT